MNYAENIAERFFEAIDYRKIWLARLHRTEGLLIGLFIYLFIATALKGLGILFNFKFVLSVAAFYMLGAGTNIINQILDIEADKFSQPKITKTRNILEDIPVENAAIHLIITMLASAILLFIIGSKILAILFASGYLLAYVYSAKPFRIKGIPFLGILANGYSGALTPLAIYFLFGANLAATMLLIIMSFLTIMAAFTICEMIDYEADKKFGDKTTAVFLGMKKSAWLAFALMLGACMPLIWLALIYNLAALILLCNILLAAEFYKLAKSPTPESSRSALPKFVAYILPLYSIYLILLVFL